MKKYINLLLFSSSILLIVLILVGIKTISSNKTNSNSITSEILIDNEINPTCESNSLSDTNSSNSSTVLTNDFEELTTKEPEESFTPITISFTGDILLSDKLYERYEANGITGFLSEKVADTLLNTDLTFINQEFPFSNRGTPEAGKEYTYCVSPDKVKIFKEMGTDIVSISNNHILDYGTDALLDTFTTLEQNSIDYVGAGINLDRAKKLIIKEVKGKKIGFLAASRVVPSYAWYALNETSSRKAQAGVFTTYDDTALCEEIKLAKSVCDFVVVYAHWGIEKQTSAADYQRIMAKNYIDAGANLVVGSHPHVMQGVEVYKNVPIVYSLGNFLFSNYYSRTTVLTATINEDNTCSISFLPCKSKAYYTEDTQGEEQNEFYSFLNDVSYGVTFSTDGKLTVN